MLTGENTKTANALRCHYYKDKITRQEGPSMSVSVGLLFHDRETIEK